MSYLFYIFNKCLDSTYAINAKLYLTYCWTLKSLLHALLLLKCLISGNMYIHIIVAFFKGITDQKNNECTHRIALICFPLGCTSEQISHSYLIRHNPGCAGETGLHISFIIYRNKCVSFLDLLYLSVFFLFWGCHNQSLA